MKETNSDNQVVNSIKAFLQKSEIPHKMVEDWLAPCETTYPMAFRLGYSMDELQQCGFDVFDLHNQKDAPSAYDWDWYNNGTIVVFLN